jgi:hypothetical protein
VSDFTPGPLIAAVYESNIGSGHQYHVVDSQDLGIATCWGQDKIAEANAALFSAAPEMYKALKWARGLIAGGFLVEQSPWFELVGAIDAVLSKAEGKSL